MAKPPTQAERWQMFFDSWMIRVLIFPLGEKIGAIATRGLTDDTPRSHRWFRVILVVLVAAFAIAVAAVGDMVAIRIAQDEIGVCQGARCAKAIGSRAAEVTSSSNGRTP